MANGTLKVENIQTSSGSGTITIGQSGETVSFPTGVSLTGNGISNKPMFQAWLSAAFSVPHATRTLIPFDVSDLNDDNCFNTSTYLFTAPSAGRYLFHCTTFTDDLDDGDLAQIWLYKNGTRDFTIGGLTKRYLSQDFSPVAGRNLMPAVTAIIDLEKDDYIQPYAYHDQGATQSLGATYSYFQGFKLIG